MVGQDIRDMFARRKAKAPGLSTPATSPSVGPPPVSPGSVVPLAPTFTGVTPATKVGGGASPTQDPSLPPDYSPEGVWFPSKWRPGAAIPGGFLPEWMDNLRQAQQGPWQQGMSSDQRAALYRHWVLGEGVDAKWRPSEVMAQRPEYIRAYLEQLLGPGA